MKERETAERYPGVEFRAMNTSMAVIAKTDTLLPYWQRPVIRWFNEVERIASRFLKSSELSKLNRSALYEPVELSSTLFQLLRTSWQYAVRTDYLFQPFIGSAMRRLGYDRHFEQLQRQPSTSGTIPELEHSAGYLPVHEPDALVFDEAGMTVTRKRDVELDLGGIGKGWSADRASQFLRREFGVSSGMVDAGGDLYVWTDGEPWCIGIQDAWEDKREIMQLWVKEAGFATSNVLHRSWRQKGRMRHHILDGRTGLPTETDVVQASVLAPVTSEAEVAAKIICMLGSDEAPYWMETHFPDLAYILVKDSGEMIINRKLSDYAVKVVQ